MNLWTSSDGHFGHSNSILNSNRPFKDVDEMDEQMIDTWNSLVKPKDKVFYLGDLAWKNHSDYLYRLNGLFIYIFGNHEHKPFRKSIVNGRFHDKILEYYDLKTFKIENQLIVMCHYPILRWDRSHYNSWHLYGHVHGGLQNMGKSWDVGVDNNGYKPINFDELKVIMDNRPDNDNLIKEKI